MRDWLGEVIGDDLIAVYEGLFFTEDALLWLQERRVAGSGYRLAAMDGGRPLNWCWGGLRGIPPSLCAGELRKTKTRR
jgi:hypothetical protein